MDTVYIPDHLDSIPLDPNYVSGFIEGDGSLIVPLSGISKYSLCLSVDQKNTNVTLLNSFKFILS